MGGCCPGKQKTGGGGKRSSSREQLGYVGAVPPGCDDDDAKSGELSPLHSKSRPTLLGGDKDHQGLYRVPDSREYLNLSCEDRTEWPVFANVDVVKRLDLSHNKLAVIRPDPRAPMEHWSNLQSLNLSCNSLRDVPAPLRDLPALTALDLSGNILRRGADEPCSVLPSMKRLRVLSLADCRIELLPRGVARSTGLTELDLSGNQRIQLDRPDGASIANLHLLASLNLSRTQLNRVPLVLQGCTALRTLDFSDCLPFTDAFDTLRDMQVETLMVRNDPRVPVGGSAQGLQGVPPQLAQLTSITTLDLSGNSVKNFDQVGAMPVLGTLVLRRCGIRRLYDPLLHSTTITALDLTGNHLTADSIQVLRGTPLALHLQILNLCGNMAAQAVTYRSMDAIGELPRLREFWFDVWADKKNAREEKAVIYSSRIPAQLARPRLELLNGVPHKDFSGTLAETFCNVLRNGTLKLDFGLPWEDEIKQQLSLLQLFHDRREWLLQHTAACVARYKLYLSWAMAQGKTASFRASGEEELIPPLDVLFVLYCHVIRPQQYLADLLRANLRVINHLPYPLAPDEQWTAGRPANAAALLSSRSRYAASARRWNERFAPQDAAPWLRYEWYLNDNDDEDAPAELPEEPVSLALDLEEEMRMTMDYVGLVVEHADVLRSHWYHSADRYFKFLCLRMLACERDRGGLEPPVPVSPEPSMPTDMEDDRRWVPTLGVKFTMHVHQCLPMQFRHDMLWYVGCYNACEAPSGEESSAAFQDALHYTSSSWREAFGEEYISQDAKVSRYPWGIAPTSPRLRRRTSRGESAMKRGSSASLQRTASAEPEGMTRRESDRRVRFTGGVCG
eukprot:TRINITY_DN55623_c0_g1_i1.p1 TRINITY_DN55623_c0_g1~~TRINITY_DN55623_c0_g1_i1.p1  ORF type:complete len:845 (+),score=268.68 TRINITY_DN55623_c0_g1_i1:123-2657(+)